jgi:hypothetical protein
VNVPIGLSSPEGPRLASRVGRTTVDARPDCTFRGRSGGETRRTQSRCLPALGEMRTLVMVLCGRHPLNVVFVTFSGTTTGALPPRHAVVVSRRDLPDAMAGSSSYLGLMHAMTPMRGGTNDG